MTLGGADTRELNEGPLVATAAAEQEPWVIYCLHFRTDGNKLMALIAAVLAAISFRWSNLEDSAASGGIT